VKHAVSVDEACELVTDGTHYTPKDVGIGVPFLTVKDVSGSGLDFTNCSFVAEDDYRAALGGNSAPQRGDVLFSKDGTVGKVHVVKTNERFAVLSSLAILRPRRNRVDADYLAHALRSPSVLNDALKRKTGSAIRRIILSDLKQIRIPLPPLPEQRRIADILDKVDALRAKRREALGQIDKLSNSIFLEMFGDPADNPKGWPVSLVGEVADVQGGLQVTRARANLPLEVPYLRVANVYRGFLDLREIKIIRATESEVARTKLVKDDFLIVEGHGNPAEIGRGALWDGSIANCVHQNHIIRARFAPTKVSAHYACEYLNSPWGRRHLLRAGKTTSGLNTISVSEVRETPIALPPIELQREFAARLQAVKKVSAAQRASSGELDGLFNALQIRAFRGEL
jgi:type I restriction enzyme S subunit